MKRIQYAVIVLAASVILLSVAVIIPAAIALAQDEELTLASLAEQVTALAGRVTALETLTADPWSPDTMYIDEDICQSPLHVPSSGWFSIIAGQVHQETADAYRVKYGVSIDPSSVQLSAIAFATEGNHVYLEYVTDTENRVVVEVWANCELLSHSGWGENERQ